jgi:ubiquinone/menaquinone biosynthesis C-methylase UbiE
MTDATQPRSGDVCSSDHARWLVTPLRRLFTDPQRILRRLVAKGETAVDLGCGPGYFTLPLARLVGENGRVIAVDLQPEMLTILERRAQHSGLTSHIELHQCSADTLGVEKLVDFALAFYVVHEVPDPARFFGEVSAMLKPGGRLLLVEPKGHVSADAFARTEAQAAGAGLRPLARPHVAFSRSVLLTRD